MTEKKYVTLKIKCCHEECGKTFTSRPEIGSDEQGETDKIVDCLFCGKPVKVKIHRQIAGEPKIIVRGFEPE